VHQVGFLYKDYQDEQAGKKLSPSGQKYTEDIFKQ
jgi:hypothetical protein